MAQITFLLIVICLIYVASVGCYKFPLRTQRNHIVDNNGERIRLAGVNWYGAEEMDFVVAGLDRAKLEDISKYIAESKFNSVRLPFSVEMFLSNPVVNATTVSANPEFIGKRAMDVFDAVIDSLAAQDIMVILDNHMSTADWCCSESDGNGLWYTDQYPEETWVHMWQEITRRYMHIPHVIGADLRNEPRTTTLHGKVMTPLWGGSNPAVDWHGAAERAGNAILAVNPNMLIFVEGIDYANNLRHVDVLPVNLTVPHRLVYSAHDYSWQLPFVSCNDLALLLDAAWGYVYLEELAPVWLGEFGTCHSSVSECLDTSTKQGLWFTCLLKYLHARGMDWNYWALDGTQARGTGRVYGAEETYGMLNIHWNATALPELLQALQTVM